VDDWVRETDTKFMTGITFREGVRALDDVKKSDGTVFVDSERMYPHVFQVLDASKLKKTNKPFITRNPNYRESIMHELFEPCHGRGEDVDDMPYLLIQLDLDKKRRAEYLQSLQFDMPGETMWQKMYESWKVDPSMYKHVRVMLKDGSKYPDKLIVAHATRFNRASFRTISETECKTSVVSAPMPVIRADESIETNEYENGKIVYIRA
jgi:hypothetical protein